MLLVRTQRPYGGLSVMVNSLKSLCLAIPLLASLPAGAADKPLVLAFGDSLTAGYGLPPGESFPDRLGQALEQSGLAVTIVNAGVSGDTSSGGRARLGWTLDGLDRPPDLAILALGANDALRGIDPAITRRNLNAMIETLKARDVPILLAGMLAPPNLGPDYGDAFNSLYPDLAAQHAVALYPFLLDGVAADPRLNQADGIHPNPQGVAKMVSALQPLVTACLQGKNPRCSKPNP